MAKRRYRKTRSKTILETRVLGINGEKFNVEVRRGQAALFETLDVEVRSAQPESNVRAGYTRIGEPPGSYNWTMFPNATSEDVRSLSAALLVVVEMSGWAENAAAAPSPASAPGAEIS